MDWESLLSYKRVNSKERPTDQGRTPFQKDYDRIVFVPSFRRLQRKTQVHPFPTNDHIHTRLTHSIEVSCVGRSLGTLVGEMLGKTCKLPKEIDPRDIGDLVQVGCLAHDIGNPPFGHAGEYAVRDWFKRNEKEFLYGVPEEQLSDFVLFEGNAQGFRSLTRLEYRPHEGGLRLTYASLATFLKYPWTSDSENAKRLKKFGAFYDDRETLETVMSGVNIKKDAGGGYSWHRHPLAYLVEAADDICYALLDLEDGREMGLLTYSEVKERFVEMGGNLTRADEKKYANPRTNLALLRGGAFQHLITEVSDAFQKHERAIMSGKFRGDLLDECPSGKFVKGAKRLGQERVYTDKRKTQLELGAYSTIDVLLNSFLTAAFELKKRGDASKVSFKSKKLLDLMESTLKPDCDRYELITRTLDFITGMTDNYATFIANQLVGIAG